MITVLLVLCSMEGLYAGDKPAGLIYLSPLQGSTLVSRSTNIIARQKDAIGTERARDLEGASITGSSSGRHNARFIVSDDGETAVWTPTSSFLPGETVTVVLPEYSWSFTVSGMTEAAAVVPPSAEWNNALSAAGAAPIARPLSRADSVPPNFPVMKIDTSISPSPEPLFMTTTNILPGLGFYAMTLDNTGNPVAYKSTAPFSCNDFKVLPNGRLSYARVTGVASGIGISQTVQIVLDSTLAVVDSFKCGNGYTADFHEFLLQPNGHAYLMAADPQVVDMSQVVPGGNPNAVVYGSIIQELDASKNVIFQWRSWDYIPITDCYDNLTATTFDYIHVNSLEIDTDGNLLVSCRETASILKIDHLTGNVLWRWGGKHNQVSFIGDNSANAPNFFSYQHDVRRIANGHITLMDNGNQHSPPYSRAAEYALDESAMTATLVWEYRHVPDVFNPAAGSVQRLPNGNTVVGWGTSNFLGVGNVAVTEVKPDKSVAFELSMPKGLFSYRAKRFAWKTELPSATVNMYDLQLGVSYQFTSAGETTGVAIKLSSGTAGYNRVIVTRYPFAPHAPSFGPNAPGLAPVRTVIAQNGFLSFTAGVTFDSSYTSMFPYPGQTTVYYRAAEGTGTFSPLATTYDAGKHTLTVNTSQFGEFAFGWSNGTAVPTAPALIAPVNAAYVNELTPVSLSWSSKGRALRFNIQIATDSAFAHMSVNDSSASPAYTLSSPLHDTTYYWRTQAVGDSAVSGWSSPWKFVTRFPFIGVTYPQGGETFYKDSVYIVRWQTNQSGLARLVLLNGGSPAIVIADSQKNSGAYRWTVPGTLLTGSAYTVSIKSVTDTTVSSVSAGPFTIGVFVASVTPTGSSPQVFALDQNFPNPFNPATEIRYAIPRRASVSIEVYNTLGQQVATLVNEMEEAGFHQVRFDGTNLASGLYFYRIRAHPSDNAAVGSPAAGQAGDFVMTKKLLLLR